MRMTVITTQVVFSSAVDMISCLHCQIPLVIRHCSLQVQRDVFEGATEGQVVDVYLFGTAEVVDVAFGVGQPSVSDAGQAAAYQGQLGPDD